MSAVHADDVARLAVRFAHHRRPMGTAQAIVNRRAMLGCAAIVRQTLANPTMTTSDVVDAIVDAFSEDGIRRG